MNHRELSKEIIQLTGGQENITQAWHCITRLRFNVREQNKVQLAQIKALDSVLGAQFQNDQFQVVIGNQVAAVYEQIEDQMKQSGISKPETDAAHSKGINAVLDTISGIFTPILPAIVGTGMLRGFWHCSLHLERYRRKAVSIKFCLQLQMRPFISCLSFWLYRLPESSK